MNSNNSWKGVFYFLKLIIGWPLVLIAFFFVAKTIFPNAQNLTRLPKELNILLILYGIICFLLYYFIRSYLWKMLLREKGYDIPFREVAFLWAASEIKRFIPGNIWSFIGKAVSLSEVGVGKKNLAQIMLWEIEFFILGCITISLLSIPFFLTVFSSNIYSLLITFLSVLLVFILLILYIFSSYIGKRLANKKTAFIKNALSSFSPKTNLIFILISCISLVFFGLGMYFSVASLVFLNPYHLIWFIGFFVFALFVGYASLITPMGLGIREGVIAIGLSKILTIGVSGFAAIYSRIILIASELIFLFATFILKNIKNSFIPKAKQLVKNNSREIFLVLIITTYIVYFTTASFLRYTNYYTGRFDLGNMDQAVWNTLHGRIFEITDPNGTNIISRLAFHADFLLVLLSPFYLIWSDPRMLLFIQTVVVALGAFFVYVIAKDILKNKNIAVGFAVLFLLNPALEYTNLYDFHPVTLATTFLLAAFYFLRKQKYIWFLIFLALASISKEEIFLISAIFGIYIFFEGKKRIFGASIVIISLATFYYLIWHAIPNTLGSQHFALSYYSDFGGSPSGIIKNIIISPQKTLGIILGKDQLLYIFELFFPLGFISFFSPLILVFAFPDLFINLLSSNSQLHEIYYQYSSAITPFIFIAAIFGIKKLKALTPKIPQNFYICYLVFTTLVSAYFFGPLPGARKPNMTMFLKPQKERETIDNFLKNIPSKFSIAATNNLGSHLSHRQKIFTIPVGIDKADIIAFLLNDPFAQPSLKAQKETARKMENDKNYIQVFKKDDFIVFEKRNLYLLSRKKKIREPKLFPLSIQALQNRDYKGGKITIERKVKSTKSFTSHIISYPSDGLKLYSLMNVPTTPKPPNGYPVVIINHGYINPKDYNIITSYETISDYFSSRGFLVLKPDFRGNGKSEIDNKALMRFAYPIDVMNLIASLKYINEADENNIYLWGHSMGGEVTLEVLEIIGKKPELEKDIKAAVVWAPVTDPLKWFSRSHISMLQEARLTPFPYTQTFKILGYPGENPNLWQSISPLNFLKDIKTPIQIDHGTSDQTVPYEWSANLYNDLMNLNKNAELISYPGSDHNLYPLWKEAASNSLKFFKKH